MIKCALSPEQLEKLALYNIVLLKEKVANNEPLDLKAHLTLIYNKINERLKDTNTALDYARISAIQVFKSATYLDSLDTLKTDLNKLKEVYVAAKNPDTGLQSMSDFLDLKKEPVKKIETQQKKASELAEKKLAEKAQKKESENAEEFRGRPANISSTTINELIDDKNPKLGKDPKVEFFANFIRENLRAKKSQPVFLSLVHISRIPDDQRLPKVLPSEYVYVVSDENGNFLNYVQEDGKYKQSEDGKLIYFGARPLPGKSNGKYNWSNYKYAQSPEQIRNRQQEKEPIEKIEADLTAKYDGVKQLYDALDQDKDSHFLFTINSSDRGSLGGAVTELNTAEKHKPSEIREPAFQAYAKKVGRGKISEAQHKLTYLFEKGKGIRIFISGYPTDLFIETNVVPDTEITKLVTMFTETLKTDKGEYVTAQQKVKYLSNLFRGAAKEKAFDRDGLAYNGLTVREGTKGDYFIINEKVTIAHIDKEGKLILEEGVTKEQVQADLKEAFSKNERGYKRDYAPVFKFTEWNFNEYTITETDGEYVATKTSLSPLEYMDKIFTVKANLDNDGRLLRYNPYFNVSLTGSEIVKSTFPAEVKSSTPSDIEAKKQKIADLRAKEQAEYAAMSNPNDQAKRKEIYDRYDKLITPLLDEVNAASATPVSNKKAASTSKVEKVVKAVEKETKKKTDEVLAESKKKKVKEDVPDTTLDDILDSNNQDILNILQSRKGTKGLNELIDQKDIIATVEQIIAAKEWWESSKNPLKGLVGFKEAFHAFNPADQRAIAKWTLAGITLFKGADYSDVYHEAWHAFTQLFMTKEQKARMYNELRGSNASFKAYTGKTVAFNEATDLELEEHLAKQFRNFMLTGKVKEDTPVVNSIFQWLLNLLKKLFGTSTVSDIAQDPTNNAEIQKLFTALATNNEYFKANFSFSESNVDFSILNSNRDVKGVLEDTKTTVVIARKDAKLISQSIDSVFIKVIDTLNKKHNTVAFTTGLFTSRQGRQIGYLAAQKEFTAKLESTLNKIDKLQEEFSKFDKKVKGEELLKKQELEDDIKEATYMADLLTTALANFGNPADLDNPEGVIKFHTDYSDLIDDRDRYFSDEQDITIKNEFERFGGNEISASDLAQPNLKYAVKTLYSYDEEGNKVLNKLGFPIPANERTTFNKLMNLTEGAEDSKEIYTMLSEASQDYPVVDEFLEKLGPPSAIGADGELVGSAVVLWAAAEKVFTMPRIPLRMLKTFLDEELLDNDDVSQTLAVRHTEGTASFRKVGQFWNNQFRVAEEGNYILKNPDTDGNYLDVDSLLDNPKYSEPISLKKNFDVDVAYEFLKDIGITLEDSTVAKEAFKAKGLDTKSTSLYLILRAINQFNFGYDLRKDLVDIQIKEPEMIFSDYSDMLLRSFKPSSELSGNERAEVRKIKSFLTGAATTWNDLQKFQLKWSADYSDAVVENAKGDRQYEKSQRSTMSNQITKVNKAKSRQELTKEGLDIVEDRSMTHLSRARNPFVKGSLWMRELFNEVGRKNVYEDRVAKINKPVSLFLENHAGYAAKIKDVNNQISSFGIDSSGSDDTSKMLGDFMMMLLYGTEESVRFADKSFTPLVKLLNGQTHYIPYTDFLDVDARNALGRKKRDQQGEEEVFEQGDGIGLFTNQLIEYLASEYERIQKLKDGDEAGNATVGKGKTYKDVGTKFAIFGDILTKHSKIKIESLENIKGVKTHEEFLEYLDSKPKIRTQIEDAFASYLTNITATFQKSFVNTGILKNDLFYDFLFKSLGGDPENEDYIDNRRTEYAKDYIKSAMMAYVANSWIHKFEFTTVLMGDPALFDGVMDFFKRDAGYSATGDFPNTSPAMITAINQMFEGENSYASKRGFTTAAFGKTMNTAVMEDVASKSVYLKTYVETVQKIERTRLEKLGVGKKEIDEKLKSIEKLFNKAYGKMTEADGQGYISFDSYRKLLKSLNKWSNEQEESYIKIINGEDVEDVYKVFPVKKLQYWGPLDTNGLPVLGFHKFSVFPLVPNAIKDTQLEILHDKMMEDQIDYSTFKSGSKLNSLTKDGKVDKFFTNADRSTSDLAIQEEGFEFTKNPIFLNYLKDQLEVNDYYKNKVTFSSQMRKLITRGMFENGIPVDWKTEIKDKEERLATWTRVKDKDSASVFATLNSKFNSLLDSLVEAEKKKIIEQTGSGKDFKKLVEFIKKELRQPGKDLSDNELDYIDIGIDANALLRDLDLSPSANLIEKALVSIAQKRILNQKLVGESLTQVSGVGFETPGKLRAATEEEQKKYGTGGLRFYNPVFDKDGNVVSVQSMQIKMSIQGPFKELLKDNEVLKHAAEKGMTALDALNDLIKTEEWISKPENKKKVTMVGVRIPVQGLNSMEVMEVAEFLPETSGPVVVLPSEIVAKSGGDFDIDKMFTLFPSFFSKKEINKEAYQQLSEEVGYNVTKASVERLLKKAELAAELDMDQVISEDEKDLLRRLEFYDLSQISIKHRQDKTKAGIQNDLIDVMSEIILHPNNFSTLITPNTTDLLEGYADELAMMQRGDDSKLSMHEIFETERNRFIQQSNNVGKTILGIIAVVNTFNSIFGSAGLILEPTRVISEIETKFGTMPIEHRQALNLQHNNINGKISLSGLYSANSMERIEDLISQLINGSVDVAKKAWIFDIQGNQETINTLLFLVMAGVPAKKAIYFVSQPMITEYTKKQREYKSSMSHLLGKFKAGSENMFRIDARDEILFGEEYGFGFEKGDFVRGEEGYGRPEKGPIFKALEKLADSVDLNDEKALYDNISKHKEGKYTALDRAAFAHFLEIQEMANQITELTQSLNFDRSKTTDLLDARIKAHKLGELSNGISEDTIKSIIEDSPVAAYNTNDFILKLFGRDAKLFGLRDNKVFMDYLISMTEKDKSGIPPVSRKSRDMGMEEATYLGKLRDNVTNYIFQKDLYDFDQNATSYKGYPIVRQSGEFGRGAFIKDGKIYLSPDSIRNAFFSRAYEKGDIWNMGKAAPLTFGMFSIYTPEVGLKLYTKFLIEREIIMNLPENSFEEVSTTPLYKKYLKEKNKAKSAEPEAKAYQMVIRDKALDNLNYHGHMFFGDRSYPSKIAEVVKKYPVLKAQYPFLAELDYETEDIEFDTIDAEGNAVKRPVRFNRMKFKSIRPDVTTLDDFADDITALSDSSIKKVRSRKENAEISKLFSRLGTFIMLQTGNDVTSPFSMIRALPSTMLYGIQEKAYKDFVKNIDYSSIRDYQSKFDKQYSKLNSLKNKFLNFESVDVDLEEVGAKTTAVNIMGINTYTGKIKELDSNQVFVFGSNPIGINGNLKTNKGGAALAALRKGWVEQDEIMNNTRSGNGQSYGIVTVTKPGASKSLTPEEIKENIKKFYKHATENPDYEFLVAYDAKDRNLNGYTGTEMADMFSAFPIPNNVVFEKNFAKLLTLAPGESMSKKVTDSVTYVTDEDIIEFNKNCASKK